MTAERDRRRIRRVVMAWTEPHECALCDALSDAIDAHRRAIGAGDEPAIARTRRAVEAAARRVDRSHGLDARSTERNLS